MHSMISGFPDSSLPFVVPLGETLDSLNPAGIAAVNHSLPADMRWTNPLCSGVSALETDTSPAVSHQDFVEDLLLSIPDESHVTSYTPVVASFQPSPACALQTTACSVGGGLLRRSHESSLHPSLSILVDNPIEALPAGETITEPAERIGYTGGLHSSPTQRRTPGKPAGSDFRDSLMSSCQSSSATVGPIIYADPVEGQLSSPSIFTQESKVHRTGQSPTLAVKPSVVFTSGDEISSASTGRVLQPELSLAKPHIMALAGTAYSCMPSPAWQPMTAHGPISWPAPHTNLVPSHTHLTPSLHHPASVATVLSGRMPDSYDSECWPSTLVAQGLPGRVPGDTTVEWQHSLTPTMTRASEINQTASVLQEQRVALQWKHSNSDQGNVLQEFLQRTTVTEGVVSRNAAFPQAQIAFSGSPMRSRYLWLFLLRLLEDPRYASLITWTQRSEREFQLRQPEEVASLWGRAKRRPNMTYDKMSRAMRYYYRQNVMCKVRNKRYVYRFVRIPTLEPRSLAAEESNSDNSDHEMDACSSLSAGGSSATVTEHWSGSPKSENLPIPEKKTGMR